MFDEFSWVDMLTVTGWPLWLVLGCNSILMTLIYERLWYLRRPIQLRIPLLRHLTKRMIRSEWDKLFFQEQKRVHMGLPLIHNLIIVCFLTGLSGSLINLMRLIGQDDLIPFHTSSMHDYVFIFLGLPLIVGIASSILGLIALRLYVVMSKWYIKNYSRFMQGI